MIKRYTFCSIAILAATLCLFNSSASAHEKVVVVTLGGTVGNATTADVVKGKTFSRQCQPKEINSKPQIIPEIQNSPHQT